MLEADEEWVKETLVEEERRRCISRVLNAQAENAVGKGNNYISDIYRFNLKVVLHSGEIQNRSLIYKILPKAGDESKMPGIKEMGVFMKETRMYSEVLPAMERLQLEKEPDGEPLWPRLIGFKRNYEGLLMEDISVLGYKMEDRIKGLDFDDTVASLEGIAKFHALAAASIKRGDISTSDFDAHFFFGNKTRVKEMTENLNKSYHKLIEEVWKGEWLKILDDLDKVITSMPDELVDSNKRDDTKFNTLVHGDYWLNNILFRRDSNGRIKHLRIVDYQMCFYNNPCYDVHCLFYSTLRPQFFGRIPELLRIYYESLVKNLKLFQYEDIPTFEYIEESFHKLKMYAIQAALCFRPIVTGDHPMSKLKELYPDEMNDCFTYVCVRYGGESILNAVQASLKHFKKIGYLK